MSDDDMIRRGDAIAAIESDGEFVRSIGLANRLRTLPAVEVGVKHGEIERAVWSAMIWAASNNPAFNDLPEYTDRGNSFAEDECRRAAARIRSALIATPAQDVAGLVEEAGLLLDAYKAVLVLHRVMDKHGLTAGASAAENIADRIVAAHPEFPALARMKEAGE